MINRSISILLNGDKFNNATIFEHDFLFWSQTKELGIMSFTKVIHFNVNILRHCVNLCAFSRIYWEKRGFTLLIFDVFEVGNDQMEGIQYTKCPWCHFIELISGKLL